MQTITSLHILGDDALREHFTLLVATDHQTTADLLRCIDEIDHRKLWAKEGCSSMFVWCVKRFFMSESMVSKRIRAARTARRFPLIFEMVARGELHLTGIGQLSTHLTEGNHRSVLARAKHMTMREIEKLVAEIAPKPDVASRVITLPRRAAPQELIQAAQANNYSGPKQSPTSATTAELPPDNLASSAAARPSSEPLRDLLFAGPDKSAGKGQGRVAPLSPRRYKVEITVGEKTHDTLRQLEELLSHQIPSGDPALIIERALEELLKKTLKTKAAITDKPRPAAPRSNSTKTTRTIPAEVRRNVWQRDGGSCAFTDEKGRRCDERRFIEYHHTDPYGRGGVHRVETIELRCAAHNQYEADRDYGESFMKAKRGVTKARESVAGYGPEPNVQTATNCTGKPAINSAENWPRYLPSARQVERRERSAAEP